MCELRIRLGCRRKKRKKLRAVFVLGPDRETAGPVAKTPQYQSSRKGDVTMAFELPYYGQKRLSVRLLDKRGNPATPDGTPEWTCDNTDVLALVPEADGMACLVKAVGPVTNTTTNITFSCDADRGAGVKPVLATAECTRVTGGDVETATIDEGPTEDQPATP